MCLTNSVYLDRSYLTMYPKVVPAGESTSTEWTYPPFSGHYDGEFIWGRGSEDDKSNLIAMLTAIDCLLQYDFEPDRTLIVAVGFDEEGGADQSYGARCLAETLIKRYGRNGVELIVCRSPQGRRNLWH